MKIALIGDVSPQIIAHLVIPQALTLSAQKLGKPVEHQWIATPNLDIVAKMMLKDYDGIWAVPGSPYESKDGALAAIQYARENKIPLLGTCGGYQHAVLEFARNVLGQRQADSLEDNPQTAMPLIAPLSCSLIDESGQISLLEDSRLATIMGNTQIEEKYHCSFGINRDYLSIFKGGDLRISGFDSDGDPRSFELLNHPFFFGTAFQPERSGLEGRDHPLITAFVEAASK